MLVPASSLVNIKKFPPGRAAFALRQVVARALERGADPVAALASVAGQQAARTMSLELLLSAARTSLFPPEASELDTLADYGITGLSGYCEVQMRLYHGQERAAAAARIRRALLPDGVGAVTRLPYAEQHQRVAALIERALGPALAADMVLLPEMAELIARLRVINDDYGAALARTDDAPTREELRAARAQLQELLAATVGMILGHYALQGPQGQADRDYLLEPILVQDEALTAARRRRRVPRDVDPDTGVEVPGPVETAPGSDDDTDGDEPGASAV
jgi:hypothetical protein